MYLFFFLSSLDILIFFVSYIYFEIIWANTGPTKKNYISYPFYLELRQSLMNIKHNESNQTQTKEAGRPIEWFESVDMYIRLTICLLWCVSTYARVPKQTIFFIIRSLYTFTMMTHTHTHTFSFNQNNMKCTWHMSVKIKILLMKIKTN